jgi:hypothetical protein
MYGFCLCQLLQSFINTSNTQHGESATNPSVRNVKQGKEGARSARRVRCFEGRGTLCGTSLLPEARRDAAVSAQQRGRVAQPGCPAGLLGNAALGARDGLWQRWKSWEAGATSSPASAWGTSTP